MRKSLPKRILSKQCILSRYNRDASVYMPFNFFTSPRKKAKRNKASQTSLLTWQEHKVAVSRKTMKSIRLKLSNDGELKLSCPHFVSDPELLGFLNERQAWIEKQQQKLASRQEALQQSMRPGHICLWGEQQPLSSFVDLPVETLTQQQMDKLQQEVLRNALKTYIAGHLPHWQQQMGVEATFWNVRAMKTKWGSCNVHKKRIWLNVQLASYPLICAEMVLVHELVHLLEPSHNKRFYHLMDTYLPDWRKADEILKQVHL